MFQNEICQANPHNWYPHYCQTDTEGHNPLQHFLKLGHPTQYQYFQNWERLYHWAPFLEVTTYNATGLGCTT